jgi:hypothetical protein
MPNPSPFGRTLALIGLIFSLGCSGGGDENPNLGDPLADAAIARCDMPLDHACREYQRGRQGDATAFVDLPSARKSCAAGWPGGADAPGVFSGDACSVETALGRCYTQTHTLPRLITLDYYYEGFADTDTRTEPLKLLESLCAAVESNAKAGGVDVTSTFQAGPF